MRPTQSNMVSVVDIIYSDDWLCIAEMKIFQHSITSENLMIVNQSFLWPRVPEYIIKTSQGILNVFCLFNRLWKWLLLCPIWV